MIDLNSDISEIQAQGPRVLTKEEIKTLSMVEAGKVPNQRTLIIPDPGMTIIDMDLNSADPHFVAWEANDALLKQVLKEGKSVHLENAKAVWGDRMTKASPEYKLAKVGGNAINYGAYPKKLSKALGISMKLAEWFYHRWFQIHPGIREWHNRTRNDLATKRLVKNIFGFERYYFDRPENCLNDALAWGPQSSVGIVINKAWVRIDAELPQVEVLIQDHDNLVMQAPRMATRELLPQLQEKALVIVPYDDPLIIPVGFKISDISWGDVEDPCGVERKEDVSSFKDSELATWLATGLQNAREKALSQLAR